MDRIGRRVNLNKNLIHRDIQDVQDVEQNLRSITGWAG